MRSIWKSFWLGLTLAALPGCQERQCIRQSDCPKPLICSVDLICVDPTVDLSQTDMPSDAAIDGSKDIAGSSCESQLRCLVYTSVPQRHVCVDGLPQSDQDEILGVLSCSFRACPMPCMSQVGSIEIADPNVCWGCVVTKLGGTCSSPNCR